MGTARKLWKEVEGVLDHQSFHGSEESSMVDNEGNKERSQRYLRSWGTDYPYLRAHRKDEQRWLPVPEDSDVQRFMRNPFKISFYH
jgi:hypothetical protein